MTPEMVDNALQLPDRDDWLQLLMNELDDSAHGVEAVWAVSKALARLAEIAAAGPISTYGPEDARRLIAGLELLHAPVVEITSQLGRPVDMKAGLEAARSLCDLFGNARPQGPTQGFAPSFLDDLARTLMLANELQNVFFAACIADRAARSADTAQRPQ